MIEIILMLILAGLFISSRARAVAFYNPYPKPKNNVEDYADEILRRYNNRGLGWKDKA